MSVRDTEEYKELQAAFLGLWTKYTHEWGYDKSEWKRVRDAIEKMIDRSAAFDPEDDDDFEIEITEEDESRVRLLLREGRELREAIREKFATSRRRGNRRRLLRI